MKTLLGGEELIGTLDAGVARITVGLRTAAGPRCSSRTTARNPLR